METFCTELADIFDVDETKPTDILEDFEEYDSLTILTIISLAGSKYNKTISAKEVKGCQTVQDLYNLIKA